jgi:hypothetical protein
MDAKPRDEPVTPSTIRERLKSLLPEAEGIDFKVDDHADVTEAGEHVFVSVVVDVTKEKLNEEA